LIDAIRKLTRPLRHCERALHHCERSEAIHFLATAGLLRRLRSPQRRTGAPAAVRAVIPEAASQASLRSLRKLACARLSGIHEQSEYGNIESMDSGLAPLARPGMTLGERKTKSPARGKRGSQRRSLGGMSGGLSDRPMPERQLSPLFSGIVELTPLCGFVNPVTLPHCGYLWVLAARRPISMRHRNKWRTPSQGSAPAMVNSPLTAGCLPSRRSWHMSCRLTPVRRKASNVAVWRDLAG
jgi:hypothetical protein